MGGNYMKTYKQCQEIEAQTWCLEDPKIRRDKAIREYIRYPQMIKQIEVLSELPNETFVINSNGKMYGIAPSLEDTTLKYKIITLPFKITKIDNSVENLDFTLLIIDENFNTETDTIIDSDLDLVLQVSIDAYCNRFDCYVDSCLNNCGYVGCSSFNFPERCGKLWNYCECEF